MNDEEYNIMQKVHKNAKAGEFAEPFMCGKALILDPTLVPL